MRLPAAPAAAPTASLPVAALVMLLPVTERLPVRVFTAPSLPETPAMIRASCVVAEVSLEVVSVGEERAWSLTSTALPAKVDAPPAWMSIRLVATLLLALEAIALPSSWGEEEVVPLTSVPTVSAMELSTARAVDAAGSELPVESRPFW